MQPCGQISSHDVIRQTQERQNLRAAVQSEAYGLNQVVLEDFDSFD